MKLYNIIKISKDEEFENGELEVVSMVGGGFSWAHPLECESLCPPRKATQPSFGPFAEDQKIGGLSSPLDNKLLERLKIKCMHIKTGDVY